MPDTNNNIVQTVTVDTSQAVLSVEQLQHELDNLKSLVESENVAQEKSNATNAEAAAINAKYAESIKELNSQVEKFQDEITVGMQSASAATQQFAGATQQAQQVFTTTNSNLLATLAQQKVAFTDLARVVDGQGLSLRNLTSTLGLLGPQFFIAGAAIAGVIYLISQLNDTTKEAVKIDTDLKNALDILHFSLDQNKTDFAAAKTAIDAYLVSLGKLPSQVSAINIGLDQKALDDEEKALDKAKDSLQKGFKGINDLIDQQVSARVIGYKGSPYGTLVPDAEATAKAQAEVKKDIADFFNVVQQGVAEGQKDFSQEDIFKHYIGDSKERKAAFDDYVKDLTAVNDTTASHARNVLQQETERLKQQQQVRTESEQSINDSTQAYLSSLTNLYKQNAAENSKLSAEEAGLAIGSNELQVEYQEAAETRSFQISQDFNKKQLAALQTQYANLVALGSPYASKVLEQIKDLQSSIIVETTNHATTIQNIENGSLEAREKARQKAAQDAEKLQRELQKSEEDYFKESDADNLQWTDKRLEEEQIKYDRLKEMLQKAASGGVIGWEQYFADIQELETQHSKNQLAIQAEGFEKQSAQQAQYFQKDRQLILENNKLSSEDKLKALNQDKQLLDAEYDSGLLSDRDYSKQLEENTKSRIEVRNQELQAYQTVSDSLGQIMSSLTDLGAQNTAAAKAIGLAQIAISAGVAIAKATAAASDLPFPANLAAIASSIAVVVADIAQASKLINSADVPGSSSSSASVSLSAGGGAAYIAPNIPSTANLTTLSPQSINALNDQISNNPTKVVVLESDISATQQRIAGYQQASVI